MAGNLRILERVARKLPPRQRKECGPAGWPTGSPIRRGGHSSVQLCESNKCEHASSVSVGSFVSASRLSGIAR